MAANSIQIVDRQKTIQIMQKECLEEREAEIYRTLLRMDIQSRPEFLHFAEEYRRERE